MEISAKYLKRMAAITSSSVEIGITGGGDGVDDTTPTRTCTQAGVAGVPGAQPRRPGMFSIAAAFVCARRLLPGNVSSAPILEKTGRTSRRRASTRTSPCTSCLRRLGSSREDIREAIGYGVIKMNIDTDTQWSFWDGVKDYVADKKDYLQGQIGNPDGPEKPNKKYYDPRMWIREAETYTVDRLVNAYEDLNAVDALSK